MSTITAGGWTGCWSSTYGSEVSIEAATSQCSGDLLMMGGKSSDSDVFDVIAWAPRVDVMFDTFGTNTPHTANGVGWYYSPNYSWGFAPQGAPINLNSCDTAASGWSDGPNGTTAARLCWHTSGGYIDGGWRSGANIGLNYSTDFERYLFTAQTPEPGTVWLGGLGIVLAIVCRGRYSARKVSAGSTAVALRAGR
jgi:hypothetical protein